MLVTLQLKGQSKKYSINVTWGRRKNKRLKLNLGWLDMNRIFYGRRIGQKIYNRMEREKENWVMQKRLRSHTE